MGCVISTEKPIVQRAADHKEQLPAGDPRPLPSRRVSTRLSVNGAMALMSEQASRFSNVEPGTYRTRRSSTDGRMSGVSFFGNRSSGARNSTSDVKADPDELNLGSESNAAGPPSQWLLVTGEASAGKSTLVRQLKLSNDGIDPIDAARYKREVHKYALHLFRQVLNNIDKAQMSDDAHRAAERVKQLKRRALITPDVAADLKLLLALSAVATAQDEMDDPQLCKATHHFASRLDALYAVDFVPEPLDLLHLAVPTLGQHETRVQSFPNGPLSIFETNFDLRRSSIFQGRMSRAKVRISTMRHMHSQLTHRNSSSAGRTVWLRPPRYRVCGLSSKLCSDQY